MRPERSAAFDHGAQLCQLTEPGPSCPAPRLEGADPGKEGAAGTRCASVGRVRLRGTRRPVLWGGVLPAEKVQREKTNAGPPRVCGDSSAKAKRDAYDTRYSQAVSIQVLTEPDPA